MKKITIILLVICYAVFGQEEELNDNKLSIGSWGFRSGFNIATIEVENFNSGLGSKYGFSFNFFSDNPISPGITFEWGVQYSMKGAFDSYEYEDEWGDSVERESSESSLILNYIECPALFKIIIPTDSNFDIYVNAGAVSGFNISAKTESEYYYYYYDSGSGYEDEESYSNSEDITDEVSDFEFGLIFGGGVKIPLQTGKLLIDIKYDLGLTNIIDDSQFNMTNEVWLLSLGYEFSK
ncbi:MAG: PorT family protein [Candidatus Delongbacteria bacterium]|nr:PorT family protein [Candidatus Delongbacteria bacterium]